MSSVLRAARVKFGIYPVFPAAVFRVCEKIRSENRFFRHIRVIFPPPLVGNLFLPHLPVFHAFFRIFCRYCPSVSPAETLQFTFRQYCLPASGSIWKSRFSRNPVFAHLFPVILHKFRGEFSTPEKVAQKFRSLSHRGRFAAFHTRYACHFWYEMGY